MHKFLHPIVLPTNPNDPSGTFDEGSIYYNSSLSDIKLYSQGSWQFLPNFSSLTGLPRPILTSGLMVCPFAVGSAITNANMLPDFTFWIPFSVNRRTTVSAISISVSTTSTAQVEIGIYNASSNLYPQNLLGKVTINTNAFGTRTGTLTSTITLSPNIYWIAVASNGDPSLTFLDTSSLLPLAFSGSGAIITHYRTTGTTLPNTAPTTGYTMGIGFFPLVLLTISY